MICNNCHNKMRLKITHHIEESVVRQYKCPVCDSIVYTEELEVDEPEGLRQWWRDYKYNKRKKERLSK